MYKNTFFTGACESIRCDVVQKGHKVVPITGKYWNEMKVPRSLVQFSLRPRESDALDIPKDCKVDRGWLPTLRFRYKNTDSCCCTRNIFSKAQQCADPIQIPFTFSSS